MLLCPNSHSFSSCPPPTKNSSDSRCEIKETNFYLIVSLLFNRDSSVDNQLSPVPFISNFFENAVHLETGLKRGHDDLHEAFCPHGQTGKFPVPIWPAGSLLFYVFLRSQRGIIAYIGRWLTCHALGVKCTSCRSPINATLSLRDAPTSQLAAHTDYVIVAPNSYAGDRH